MQEKGTPIKVKDYPQSVLKLIDSLRKDYFFFNRSPAINGLFQIT